MFDLTGVFFSNHCTFFKICHTEFNMLLHHISHKLLSIFLLKIPWQSYLFPIFIFLRSKFVIQSLPRSRNRFLLHLSCSFYYNLIVNLSDTFFTFIWISLKFVIQDFTNFLHHTFDTFTWLFFLKYIDKLTWFLSPFDFNLIKMSDRGFNHLVH